MTLSPPTTVEVDGDPFSVRLVGPVVPGPVVAEPKATLDAVPEAVVQHAWGRGLFGGAALRTTEGEAVRVVRPGRFNRASGPDFSDALVWVGGLAWAGDVEVHRTSADWERHGHHTDPAYGRVVLHVVLSADARTGTLRRHDGSALPELVLLPHLDRGLAAVVRSLASAPDAAPRCRARWAEVPDALVAPFVRALGAERLRSKARALGQAFGRTPDLDALLVGRVFRALGYSDNADAMETLAARLPLAAVRSLSDPSDVHALVLGAAGWLRSLVAETDDAAQRFTRVAPAGMVPMAREAWRHGGRPANAPRRRLAQGAALLAPGWALRQDAVARFAEAVSTGPDAALDLLRPETADGTPRLGLDRARDAFVNAVAPVLLLDAEFRGDPALDARVLDAVAALPSGHDRISAGFEAAGLAVRTALDAQGVQALARDYCDEGRCARCAVGRHLWPGLST